ncbi:hypothetical protein BBJ29_007522 [Phytophthora kernoviae]|uniref:Uncharacterized protein n=1 Tax=Phytophthora kernoviae TaxID=325452 RepID=A0A3F2REL1_9STRA|nr:hypothetical protein BBJ29_007522 [Phytophthora kernoviae]RLN54903.1 hypothetical protein BBP00_00008737 [Phytophthora kernoviae]
MAERSERVRPETVTTKTADPGRRGYPRTMSGLTPNTPGSELMGLQDVLAFIADFEMEEDANGREFGEAERSEQHVIREQDVKYDDISGMYLEFHHSKLLPFDIDTANRATWRHISEIGIKFNTYFEESTEVRDNMVLRKFGVEFKLDDRVAKMSGRQAWEIGTLTDFVLQSRTETEIGNDIIVEGLLLEEASKRTT